jgi:hypothetical protein
LFDGRRETDSPGDTQSLPLIPWTEIVFGSVHWHLAEVAHLKENKSTQAKETIDLPPWFVFALNRKTTEVPSAEKVAEVKTGATGTTGTLNVGATVLILGATVCVVNGEVVGNKLGRIDGTGVPESGSKLGANDFNALGIAVRIKEGTAVGNSVISPVGRMLGKSEENG